MVQVTVAAVQAQVLEQRRQLNQVMLMLNEAFPGCVCLNSACPTFLDVPHMATDGGPHPHPYGLVNDGSHEWRRKPWWRRRHN